MKECRPLQATSSSSHEKKIRKLFVTLTIWNSFLKNCGHVSLTLIEWYQDNNESHCDVSSALLRYLYLPEVTCWDRTQTKAKSSCTQYDFSNANSYKSERTKAKIFSKSVTCSSQLLFGSSNFFVMLPEKSKTSRSREFMFSRRVEVTN